VAKLHFGPPENDMTYIWIYSNNILDDLIVKCHARGHASAIRTMRGE
jgi:hypothetical protein